MGIFILAFISFLGIISLLSGQMDGLSLIFGLGGLLVGIFILIVAWNFRAMRRWTWPFVNFLRYSNWGYMFSKDLDDAELHLAFGDYSILKQPMLFAATHGDLKAIQDLLSKGADPGGMPLVSAIEARQLEAVLMLIKAGSDINRGWAETTPLVHAVELENLDIVRALIDAGANVNLRTVRGISPLDVLQENRVAGSFIVRCQAIEEMLIKAGAKQSPVTNAR